jgi:hypothetical protein
VTAHCSDQLGILLLQPLDFPKAQTNGMGCMYIIPHLLVQLVQTFGCAGTWFERRIP